MSEKTRMILKEWVIPYTTLFVVVMFISKFVFYFLIVPTGSMIPTIDEKSCLFTLRVHDTDELERGDIVAFGSDELGISMVKRLIGLPGEKIVIDDTGKLYVDGVLLDEPYVKNPSPISGEFEVPEDCFFFLGDNRNGSYDARGWKQPYIGEDKVEGRAVFTIFPFNNFGTLK